jgi:hypothetical protein
MLRSLESAEHLPLRRDIFRQKCNPFVSYGYNYLLQSLSAKGRHQFRFVGRTLRDELAQILRLAAEPCFRQDAANRAAESRLLWMARRPESHNSNLTHGLTLMKHYPALARLLSQLICDWGRNVNQLSKRLGKDKTAISKGLFDGRCMGNLFELHPSLSDPHHGGRTVVALHFERGSVIYKPRDGNNEFQWSLLLRWLNATGLRPSLRVPRVIRGPGYCWMEYIHPMSCRTEAQANRYYRRLGSLVCLSHLLLGVDCHRGNLIAAGEHPVLIDTEALCHNDGRSPGQAALLPADLLRTCWLPKPLENASPLDPTEPGDHLAKLGHQTLVPSHFCKQIERGFTTTWKHLMSARRRYQFQRRRYRLVRCRWRHIVRPTSFYDTVSRVSLHPGLMQSAKARYHFILESCRRKDLNPKLVQQEAFSLFALDTPHLTRKRRNLPGLPSADLDMDRTLALLVAALRG